MPPYRLPAKHFAPIGRVFFTMLRQLSRGEIREIDVEDLLSAVPVIQYRSDADARLLQARGRVQRLSGGTALFNQPRRPLQIQVGFIQENFPPNGSNQVILADIAPRIEATHTVTDATYELVFLEDETHDPPIKRPYISFPGHPTLTGEELRRVFFNGNEVHIELQNNTIIGDYTRSPDAEGINKDERPKNERSRLVKVSTLLDLDSRIESRVVEGYYKIAKAKHEYQDCDPSDQYCDREICVVDISYEGDEIEVPDGTSEEEAIRQACESKEREVAGYPWDEVKVVWVRSAGRSETRRYPRGAGNCADDALSAGGSCECFVVTATFGESAVLDTYREFRDQFLARRRLGRDFIDWYYSHGPSLAAMCRKSRVFRAVSRFTLFCGYLVLRPIFGKPNQKD